MGSEMGIWVFLDWRIIRIQIYIHIGDIFETYWRHIGVVCLSSILLILKFSKERRGGYNKRGPRE